MVKVAYILTPVDFGGSEKVNITFLRNTNREHFDIHPILLVRPWENDNLFTRMVEEDDYVVSKIPVAIKQRHEGIDYFRVARCILYLYRIMREGKFHLVHTHGYFADIIAMPICKLLGIPQISTCHGFISNDSSLKLYNLLDKLILRFCEKIIVVSSEIMNDLVRSRINKSQIVVIQNAVQVPYGNKEFEEHRNNKRQQLLIDRDTFVIGYVGRLSEEKGVRYLIEAASLLKRDIVSFKLIILGDGPKRNELESSTKMQEADDYIEFLGFQSDIEKWMPAMDVLVLPSLSEGTPMALLEAMSVGIPIIATAVGGVPGVVSDGVNGFLVEPEDVYGLKEKILTLFENGQLRNKLSAGALKTIEEKFNAYDWCRKIEEQYDLLLQGKALSCG
jgi:glycosyltransferase involved in cell wall biosynthesis